MGTKLLIRLNLATGHDLIWCKNVYLKTEQLVPVTLSHLLLACAQHFETVYCSPLAEAAYSLHSMPRLTHRNLVIWCTAYLVCMRCIPELDTIPADAHYCHQVEDAYFHPLRVLVFPKYLQEINLG